MLLRSSTSQHYTAVSKLSKFLYSAYTSYIFNNVPNITFLLLNKLLISIYRLDAKKKKSVQFDKFHHIPCLQSFFSFEGSDSLERTL